MPDLNSARIRMMMPAVARAIVALTVLTWLQTTALGAAATPTCPSPAGRMVVVHVNGSSSSYYTWEQCTTHCALGVSCLLDANQRKRAHTHTLTLTLTHTHTHTLMSVWSLHPTLARARAAAPVPVESCWVVPTHRR